MMKHIMLYTVVLLLTVPLGGCYEDSRNTCPNWKGESPGHIVNRPRKIAQMSDAELAPLLAASDKDSPLGLLSHAVYCGNPDTVEVLLSRGADVNIRDDMGRTPFLHSMVNTWNPEISLKLLAYGADPAAVSDRGMNVLHYAGMHNVSYIFDILDHKTLLRVGPNAQTKQHSESPLHYGLYNTHTTSYQRSFIYRALREGIFDKSLQTAWGETAYDQQLYNLHYARGNAGTFDVKEQEQILRDLAFDPEALARDLPTGSEESEERI